MYEASYGIPPDDPEDVIYMTLAEFIDRQGSDPKKWRVKPYCPHCKTILRPYDKKSALNSDKEGPIGFHLVTQEILPPERMHLRRPVVGFAHQPKQAKKDCPYSYVNNPFYTYPASRGTKELETKRNIKKLCNPITAEALQEILRQLMSCITHEAKISAEHQKILDAIADTYSYVRGLFEFPFFMPVLQVLNIDPHKRPEESAAPEPAQIEAVQKNLFTEAAAVTTKSLRKRKKPVLTVVWRVMTKQKLNYVSVNDEDRVVEYPARIGLFSVHEKKGGRRYRLLRDTKGERPTVIDISRAWALEISGKYFERKARLEGKKKALTYKGGKRLSPRKKTAPGQKPLPLEAA